MMKQDTYETAVRALVALGDQVGMSALDLVHGLANGTIDGSLCVQVRSTIASATGQMVTDATLDSLMDGMADDDDLWNE